MCVVMQRVFAEDTPWHVPWMESVTPKDIEMTSRHAERTIFTRFIPPLRSAAAFRLWKDASLKLLGDRFSLQMKLMLTEEFLSRHG